jgi:N-acetylneuraminic acid mutarotase
MKLDGKLVFGWTRSALLAVLLTAAVAGCGDDASPGGGVDGPGGANAAGPGASSSRGGSGGRASFAGSGGSGASAGSGARAGNGGSSGSAGSGSAGSDGGAAAAGGDDGGSAAGDGGAALDDPPPGEYGERAPLLDANSEMAVAELDGKIYVLGGYPSSREVQTTVQVYDPRTDSWDRAQPLPRALHHPVVVGVNGKLYSLGGQGDDGDSNRTLVYDPISDGPWQELAPMPSARGAGAAAVIGDQIYVVGGRPPAANAFEVYDIGDDAWTALPDLPHAFPNRNHIAATAIDGKVHVAGGRYGGGSFSDPVTDSLDVYDPASEQWTTRAPMLRPRGGVNGVLAFGCFHVWGGEGANTGEPDNVFPDHDVYDPGADAWTSLPDLPTPIHGVTGAAFVDGLIYMPGGGTRQGGSSGSTLFQVYRPTMRCDD